MVQKMGCAPSTPDPNLMYGNKTNGTTKEPPAQNGVLKNADNERDNLKGPHKELRKRNNKILIGDVNQRYEARLITEKRLRDRTRETLKKAEAMSDKAMEEKEMLSLVSSRSRMTSRATSRTASPRAGRASCSGENNNIESPLEQSTTDVPNDVDNEHPNNNPAPPAVDDNAHVQLNISNNNTRQTEGELPENYPKEPSPCSSPVEKCVRFEDSVVENSRRL